MKPLVELKGVKKTYRMGDVEVNALRGVDLKVGKGEFVAIMGPSGSGKSTLMHTIGALDIPTEGTVLLGGEDISKKTDNELAKLRGKKIGFVFQEFNLVPALNAVENVSLPLVFQGVPSDRRLEAARVLLEEMGLGKRLWHRPTEMSGGEQQRVAVARALAVDPELILADEPTGNLDTKTGDAIMRIISGLRDERNKTIVMVTHEPEIAEFADRIVRVKDGLIESDKNNRNKRRLAG